VRTFASYSSSSFPLLPIRIDVEYSKAKAELTMAYDKVYTMVVIRQN